MPFRVSAVLVALVLLAPGALAVQRPDDPTLPQDFDLRVAPEASLAGARDVVGARFQERFGDDVMLHWGDRSDRPVLAFRPGGALAVLPAGDRVAAARAFLRAGAPAFGLDAAEVEELEAARLYETPSARLTHLTFVQRRGGVRVFGGQVRLNLDAAGRVLNVGGEWFPEIAAPGAARVDASGALRVAAAGLGLGDAVPEVVSAEPGGERRTVFAEAAQYLEAPSARLVLLPEGPGRARLVWEVLLWEATSGWDNQYRVLVDAQSGEAVLRERMTLYVTDPANASGLVFDQDPEAAPQADRSFAGDAVASPLHWVDAGQSKSRGNNIVCRADRSGWDRDTTNPLADGGNGLQFDFAFQNTYANTGALGDQDAAITNAFHLGNLYHDYLYDLGFDEQAGNYQTDNFGRGGLGGDHVNVDVQDSWALSFMRNNANWSPSLDGVPGRTNYYLWTDPRRDGAFDGKVIFHEFTHGLSTRLIGGPNVDCLGGAQGGGMGEGWGDWFAVSYYGKATDDPAGPVTVGEYVTGNHTLGIRRYPYSYDMAVDPLTYAHLCDGGGCEVHDEGEIWATVLWDLRHDMILQHGFAEGKRRTEQIVVDAMKLSPCSPNFVTMRDSLLQADAQRYGQSECVIRAAFARRGLGAAATSTGTGGTATADFSLIAPLDASVGFADAATLSWTPRPGAAGYPVARGTFGPDATLNTFADAACRGEAAGSTWTDAEVPAPDAGFYYVVAVRDACWTSHHGTRSDGTVRPVSACP